jgi:hypothetical protein
VFLLPSSNGTRVFTSVEVKGAAGADGYCPSSSDRQALATCCYSAVTVLGKMILNKMNKFPNSHDFLWKGIPFPLIIMICSG